MKRLVLFGVLALFAVLTQAQSVSRFQDYAGTWAVKFRGEVFLTFKLHSTDKGLSGTVSPCQIELGKDGEVTRAIAGDGEDSIIAARIENGYLILASKSSETGLGSQWRIKLTATNQAKLDIAYGDLEAPPLKPFLLERVSEKSGRRGN